MLKPLYTFYSNPLQIFIVFKHRRKTIKMNQDETIQAQNKTQRILTNGENQSNSSYDGSKWVYKLNLP